MMTLNVSSKDLKNNDLSKSVKKIIDEINEIEKNSVSHEIEKKLKNLKNQEIIVY